MDNHKRVSLYRLYWIWKLQFLVEKFLLRLAFGRSVLGIEHVGSTSIRCMPAKPIVDIGIAVQDYERSFWIVPLLKSFGYTYLGENSNLREYAFERTGIFASNVFVCELTGDKWKARLFFRDYLRYHDEASLAYAELKSKLVAQFPNDLLAYQKAKLPFVQEVLTHIL